MIKSSAPLGLFSTIGHFFITLSGLQQKRLLDKQEPWIAASTEVTGRRRFLIFSAF
jgi:hypothetical protein